MPHENRKHLDLSAMIVAAYVQHNHVPQSELSGLIEQTHAALRSIGSVPQPAKPVPAVPIRKSITPDWIICLEDGLKFKSLRRHLNVKYQLTPAQYREKWGLPHDYPMVAPNYAEIRSKLAKSIGLGREHIAPPASARRRSASAS
ncbi:MucR family transcriptional regulator [Bosea sp. AS-1]|uniref:MucR family transcriptional regulator n=1 Tax=Bosea sp. AS-1 TaxID=2015316 RepID=UPI0024A67D13|nr:MucR family transcriptional regulator [Bosea sp. AS-1]